VHNADAGPAPIPIKTLSVETLTNALQYACSPEAVTAAGVLGAKIRAEKGEERGVRSFTRNMPAWELRYVPVICRLWRLWLNQGRCEVDPRRVAVWWCERYVLRLSVYAAAVLVRAGKIDFADLEPYRTSQPGSRGLRADMSREQRARSDQTHQGSAGSDRWRN
jgi:sterol 3beta-glucosyltransferase